jgi:hypothetical protein
MADEKSFVCISHMRLVVTPILSVYDDDVKTGVTGVTARYVRVGP